MPIMYCHNPYPGLTTVLVKAEPADDCAMGGPHPSGLSDSERASQCSTPSECCEEGEGMGRRSNSRYFEALSPVLPFYEYRAVTHMMRREDVEQMGFVRLFVGQVPYHLEAGHVAWMMWHLSGAKSFLVEKIVRWTQSRKPCGCFHVYCAAEDVDAMLSVDQTVLCEEEGMWVARDGVEKTVLVQHCEFLRDNRDARAPLMPYQLMTVQRAISSYQRPAKPDGAVRQVVHRPRACNVDQLAAAHFSRVHGPLGVAFPTHANQLW